MSKEIEKLLQPRYEVIALFPMMDTVYEWKVGDILLIAGETNNGEKAYIHTDSGLIAESFFTDYLHLFRKLQWWEKRELKDMPEYVIDLHTGNVHRVFKWNKDSNFRWVCDITIAYLFIEQIAPATLEDFTTYTNNKTLKQ